MISHHGYDRILACPHDPSLAAAPNATRFAIAVNLHNSAPIMPSFTMQLLKLLLEVPPGNAFVIMYESGSSDDTQLWLHMLQLLLEPIGVGGLALAGAGYGGCAAPAGALPAQGRRRAPSTPGQQPPAPSALPEPVMTSCRVSRRPVLGRHGVITPQPTRCYYPPADTLLLPPSNCAAQAPARTPASCNPQVPHNITAGGSLVRAKGQERIAYLAAVRNALIQPFYDECTAPAAPAGAAAASSAGADSSNGTTILELAPSVQTACFKPQAFLFVNDVYWCPVRAQHWWQLPAAAVALAGGWCCSTLQCIRASELPAHVQDLTWDLALLLQDDAVRLLLHDADMTCGLDVVRPRLRQRSCISCMRWQLHCGRP